MKFKKFYIALLLSLFALPAIAQMDRTIAPQQYKRSKHKGEKKDFVQLTVEYYTKELALDDFQAAAIREILEDQKDAINAISTEPNMTTNERKDKANLINDKIDSKIKPMLGAEQLKKYEALQEKRKKQ